MSDSYKIYASKDYVNERALPQDAAPYQQLVTDGEGKWVPVDRLAWKESKVESKTLYHFTETAPMVNYVIMRPYNMIPDCVVGNTYHVECPQLGVDDDVVCDQFQTKFPRLLIEGKLQIDYSIMDLSTTFRRLDGGTFENGESYDFIISEQAEVETIHPIPDEYITGAPLTETDNGKVLGVVDGDYGLVNTIKTINSISPDTNGNVSITPDSLGLSSAMKFQGVVTTLPTSSTAGSVVLMGNKEYVYDSNGNWIELGDEGSHALKTVTITAGSGLTGGGTLEANRTIAHSNVITAGTAAGGSGSLAMGGTFTVPSITYDGNGHITGATTTTYTLPAVMNINNITQTTGDELILDCN